MVGTRAQVAVAAWLALAGPGIAQEKPEARVRNLAAAERAYRENLEKHKGRPDVLVLPGVLADRTARVVTVLAEATGLKRNEILEFFAIPASSGRDYESLTVALAKAHDVHRALEFIGMAPGRPVSYERLCFHPKGERVLVTLAGAGAGEPVGPLRLERCVLSRRTEQALPDTGLVFVGSYTTNAPGRPGERVYAADALGPNCIASNYNEPTTVLDVPRQAFQNEIYNYQVVHPDAVLPAGRLVELRMEPEYKDGKKRVVDLTLEAQPRPGTGGATLGECAFALKDAQGRPQAAGPGLNDALEAFAALAGRGHDPFVTLVLDDALCLQAVHEICKVLRSVEGETGIRVEPPPAGQLYYKAFVPDEKWRERAARVSQPFELHLRARAGQLAATLVHIEQVWKPETVQPDLAVTNIPLAGAEALLPELERRPDALKVILVYAQPGVTHGQLMGWLKPALPTHGTVHVFLQHP
jgi:hypothetical protein